MGNIINVNSSESEDFIKSIINVIDSIARTQTVWGILVAVFITFIFAYCIISFRKKINQYTLTQIGAFVKVKKYEKSLYIELNRNMENLRFFIMGYKWKYRLINNYNKLFTGYDAKKTMKVLGNNYKYRLNVFSSTTTIRNSLNELIKLFNEIREERETYREKFGDYFFIIRNQVYDYTNAIEQMLKICDMIEQKNIILVGSAGNGKTNLMCRLSEIAIANKIPVLLINARDIDEDCINYVYECLPLPKKIKNLQKLYLCIVSIILFFQRKYFYIMIDAINENDKEIFTKSIGKITEHFSRFSRIRIIYSCRSEYFESRFKNYFETSDTKLYIYDLMDSNYNDRATNRMFKLYCDHFNVKGEPAPHARGRLLKSLFLMRIFFEVNQNNTNSMLELQNAEIYLKYVEKIDAEVKSFDFMKLVNSVASAMLKKSDYDNVNISELNLSNGDIDKIIHVLDENLIISRNIQKGVGITKRTDEVIYFVFDELRDFCLARQLLIQAEEIHDNVYADFFDKTKELYIKRQSPIEGVLKYGYYYFKKNGYSELAKNILIQYGEGDVQRIVFEHNHRNRRNLSENSFYNFGLSLIFIDGGGIVDFEIEYIKKYISQATHHYWNIFWYLLSNEYVGLHPRIDLALKLLIEDRSYDEIIEILKYFFEDKHDYRYSYNDDKRKIYNLCDWVRHIEEKNTDLSVELKQFLTLLTVIDPYEHELDEYHEYILNRMIYVPLIDMIDDKTFEEEVIVLQKKLKSPQQIDIQSLLALFMEGEDDDC